MKKCLCTIIFVLVAMWSLAAPAQAVINDYIAYYPLENNAIDMSPNHYNMQCDGALSISTADGQVGRCAKFLDTSPLTVRYRELNHTAEVRDIASQMTVVFWMQQENAGMMAADVALIDTADGTADTNFRIVHDTNNEISITLSTSVGTVTPVASSNGSAIYNSDGWVHVAVVVDLDGSAASVDDVLFYMAKSTDASNSTADVSAGLDLAAMSTWSGADKWFTLGAQNTPNPFPYFGSSKLNGLIDELAIYDRALSGAEIDQIFALGKAGNELPYPTITAGGTITGPAAYWTFDYTNLDASTNLYDLTSGNSTYWPPGVAGASGLFAADSTAARQRPFLSSPALNALGKTATISFWFDPDAAPPDPSGDILYASDGPLDQGYSIVHAKDNAELRITLLSGTSVQNPGGHQIVTSDCGNAKGYVDPCDPGDDGWIHCAVVIDLDEDPCDTDDVTWYISHIDDSQISYIKGQDSDVNSINPYTGTGLPMTIGAAGWNIASNNIDGKLDEFVIFDRALSESEVQAVFEAGKAGNHLPLPAPTSCLEVQRYGQIMTGDLDKDCEVKVSDLKLFAAKWLSCTQPMAAGCVGAAGGSEPTMTIARGPSTPVNIDGDLSDWPPVEWIDFDVAYTGGVPPDVNYARCAMLWDETTDKIYMAVEVFDTSHMFKTQAGNPTWDSQDSLEIFSCGDNAGSDYYGPEYESAQQYRVGASGAIDGSWDGSTEWKDWGNDVDVTDPNPLDLDITRVAIDDVMTYEIAVQMYDNYGEHASAVNPTATSSLVVDKLVRFDTAYISKYGLGPSFYKVITPHSADSKYAFWQLISEYKLVETVSGLSCGDWGYEVYDWNLNCYVDLPDFSKIAKDWLECNKPGGC